MAENIPKGVERLSIHPDESRKKRKKYTSCKHMPRDWVYGFHLKNRIIRRFAKKYNLPYRTDAFYTLRRVIGHIRAVSGVEARFREISCGGRSSRGLFFVTNGPKCLHYIPFTQDEMEKVRQAMELPEGTKPKWYEVNDNYSIEDEDGFSSEDSDWDSDNPEGYSAKIDTDMYDSDSDCCADSDDDYEDYESYESDEIEVEGEAEEDGKSKCETKVVG